MRQSQAALALIRRPGAGRPCYLAQWNEGWQAYNFVGGHREGDESFFDCMRRELHEELGIDPNRDCRIATPPWRLEYTAFSKKYDQDTAYTMELFEVELLPHALGEVERDPRNAWVWVEEIQAGRTATGQTVSATMLLLLEKVGLVRAG